ncbi:YoaK family protein [Alteromonas lipolytica]|uniref:DUF1275 family protein n=1 Tax=Alteromonas lipolytica TaxID=1856405 RepID=A0A1E8FAR4_9ALTE|nr:YoaK family protein [Alteromonas lipolytica]OFI33027.1 hypothetical protein BFC17_01770 [Alteromonas lipolytica]GGF63170.1 permease [Alteromonas lipolytica]
MPGRLPKWVEVGALLLALVAGYVNAIGLLSFEHQSVSHVSGTATLLGADIFQSSWASVLHLSGVLLSFLAGATLAGILLDNASLKLGRHYDTALLIEGVLLIIAQVLLNEGLFYAHFIASAACGLQNALATRYSGAVVRTTHLTGIFTDLGIMLGAMVRGETLDTRKLQLFLVIIVGFVFGGTAGAIGFNFLPRIALILPAIVCLILAVSYYLFAKQNRAGS